MKDRSERKIAGHPVKLLSEGHRATHQSAASLLKQGFFALRQRIRKVIGVTSDIRA
jgi:hypothetical protein